MSSLRERANCLGLPADFSVVHDFFGHLTEPAGLSVRTQVDRLGFRRIDINLIRVGSDQMTAADLAEIDGAVRDTRNIYAPASLAVGRVFHFEITTAQARGAEHIGDDGEASALTSDWTVPNAALDVFFVLTYATATVGLSAVRGSCNKNAAGMTGSVVAIEESPDLTSQVLAHEVGHYLGLAHVDPPDATRLMNPSVPNGATLLAGEATDMRRHCFVKNPC